MTVVYVSPSGTQGPPGTAMLVGAGSPTDNIGFNGCTYMDQTDPNAPVYWGPKTAGTWTGHGPYTFGIGGGVQGLTAGDLSIHVGGTGTHPVLETGTLDEIATLHPAAADWSNNNHKITTVEPGTDPNDVIVLSQLPASLPPTGAAGGDLLGSNYPNPTVSKINGVAIGGTFAPGRSLVGIDSTDMAWQGTLGTGHWIFNVMAYGAKADGKQVHNGTMLTASAVLHSATANFTSADVNKVVQVKNAGNAQSTTLVGTILSVQSTTQATLSVANASGSDLTNLAVFWGTDDTPAINAALAAATTHALASGGLVKIFFPVPVNANGFYAIGGPLLHTGLGNAQIPLPLQATTLNKLTIIFEGAGSAAAFQHWEQTALQTSVTLLSFGVYANSTAQNNDINANGNPSIIGGPTTQNGYGVSPGIFNNVLPILRNLSLRNSHNANGFAWGAWDFYGCAEANVENVVWGTTGNVADGDFSNPSVFGAGESIGMLMPAPGNNDNSRCQNIACQGGYTFAAFLPEHFVTDRISILYCWAGICPVGAYAGSVGSVHAINLGQASVEACANTVCVIGVGSGGQGPWLYGVLDAEGTITFIDRFSSSGTGLNALLGEVQLVGIVNPDTVSVQSPTGLKIVNGMQGYVAREITAGTYPLKVMDGAIIIDASGGNVTVDMISAAWTPNTYQFVRIDNSGNTVTLTANGSELITVAGAAAATSTTIGPRAGLNLFPARVGGVWGWYSY